MGGLPRVRRKTNQRDRLETMTNDKTNGKKGRRRSIDALDARLLLELNRFPRATVTSLAQQAGVARNTAHARMEQLEAHILRSPERRIDATALGYPITAYVWADLNQKLLDEVGETLEEIPEVLKVQGISGVSDLLIEVVARDTEDLYRIAGKILAINGVVHTRTAIAMKQMVDFRLRPLLERVNGKL